MLLNEANDETFTPGGNECHALIYGIRHCWPCILRPKRTGDGHRNEMFTSLVIRSRSLSVQENWFKLREFWCKQIFYEIVPDQYYRYCQLLSVALLLWST